MNAGNQQNVAGLVDMIGDRVKVYDVTNKKFTWDEDKHKINKRKHKISFEEASSVFDDDYAVYFDDESHSYDEDRFIIIGVSKLDRLLLVCHCYREDDLIIRIISARRATKTESGLYGGA